MPDMWGSEGFGLSKLESGMVSDLYLALGRPRWQLQHGMMLMEQAEGFVSVDHVIETAKRIKGDSTAMLIACGKTGNVLDWWFTPSTSLFDVLPDLKALNARQDERVLVVTMDDPNTMERAMLLAFPYAVGKMDVGHFMFSRVGCRLDPAQANYCECLVVSYA